MGLNPVNPSLVDFRIIPLSTHVFADNELVNIISDKLCVRELGITGQFVPQLVIRNIMPLEPIASPANLSVKLTSFNVRVVPV